MIRSTYCRRGHKLKLGKDGRQRCPICQSTYLKRWRETQKTQTSAHWKDVTPEQVEEDMRCLISLTEQKGSK